MTISTTTVTTVDTDSALLGRIERLETLMANEIADLAALKASVDAHNAADTQFQTDVNAKVTDLEGQVATLKQQGVDTAAIDAAIADLKTSVAAQPTLALPA